MSKTNLKTEASPADIDNEYANVWAVLKPESRFFVTKTIKTVQLENAIMAIKSTHAMSGIAGTGMLLMGIPGVGKTTILKYYTDKYYSSRNDIETDTLTKVPIIRISIPSKPTIISVIKKILLELGHSKNNGTQSSLELCLAKVIKEQKVELIIFDEFQHLLREQAQASTRNVVNFIKLLMDDYKLAIVMAGTPEGYKSISAHEELYQRFTHEFVNILPFNNTTEDEIKHFEDYLTTCEFILEDCDVKIIDLTSESMLNRILLATGGKARLISRLILKVLQHTELKKCIAKSDFASAYSRMRLNPQLKTLNPFGANDQVVTEKLAERFNKKKG